MHIFGKVMAEHPQHLLGSSPASYSHTGQELSGSRGFCRADYGVEEEESPQGRRSGRLPQQRSQGWRCPACPDPV